uniref:Uncharacterized protein n=1 Tax=Arundo donax TaxID=35708 RepID=A0A0A9HHX8_ARUDO
MLSDCYWNKMTLDWWKLPKIMGKMPYILLPDRDMLELSKHYLRKILS